MEDTDTNKAEEYQIIMEEVGKVLGKPVVPPKTYLQYRDTPICNYCLHGHHDSHNEEVWWVDEFDESHIKRCRCKLCAV